MLVIRQNISWYGIVYCLYVSTSSFWISSFFASEVTKLGTHIVQAVVLPLRSKGQR